MTSERRERLGMSERPRWVWRAQEPQNATI